MLRPHERRDDYTNRRPMNRPTTGDPLSEQPPRTTTRSIHSLLTPRTSCSPRWSRRNPRHRTTPYRSDSRSSAKPAPAWGSRHRRWRPPISRSGRRTSSFSPLIPWMRPTALSSSARRFRLRPVDPDRRSRRAGQHITDSTDPDVDAIRDGGRGRVRGRESSVHCQSAPGVSLIGDGLP